jgi:hypothetical protein
VNEEKEERRRRVGEGKEEGRTGRRGTQVRVHLLGDEGTLVLEVEGALEGRRFAEEEGCIVQGQRAHCFLEKGRT